MRKLSSYILVAIKGALMGAANVVPGVSGGTIALLTGIYQELIESIKSINGKNLGLLFRGKIADFWKAINGNFLLAVAVGIVVSIFSLAKAMTWLLEHYPLQTWAFFFGLVLVSTVYMIRGLKDLKLQHWLSLLVGAACGAILCLVSPSHTSDSLPFIFICGAIAMCTMILPGISGSFILVLLGKYAFMMDAVSNLKWVILIVFAVGAIIGILAFSHAFSWLLKKAYNGTMMFLSGLMLGSLVKVWPWKVALESGVDRPVLPAQFNGEPHIAGAIIWALVGAALIVAIELAANALKKKSNPS
jgi:putative membrane protein